MTFSDPQLKAYLAGDLSADLAATLDAQLAHDDTLEARLLALDRGQSTAIRAAFDGVPDAARLEPIEAVINNAAAPVQTNRNWGKLLPFAAVLVVGAFMLGGLSQNPTSPASTWREQVAIYQALYVTETLSSIEPDSASLAVQLDRGASALGRPLDVAAVGDLDGLDLLRAQVLGFDGVPLVQLAYLSETGAPVALCAVKLPADLDEGIRSEVLAGLPSVTWSDGTYSYMIVGDIEPDRLTRMANVLQASL